MSKKDKRNKKNKVEEKVVVDVKVDEPEVIATPAPEPKKEIEIPDDMREFTIDGEVDNRKEIVSLLNGLIKRGFTYDGDWEHNFRTGIYEYIYKIKKVG